MKIPFERTIAGAYRFAFTNILSIIGIGWFPFLLLAALVGGLIYLWLPQLTEFAAMIGKVQDKQNFDPAHAFALLAPIMGSYLLVIIAATIIQAMVNVGLMRKALGQHPGPVFVFFSLGSQVWRLIGSYLLLILFAWGAVLLCALAIGGVSLLLSKFAEGAAAAVTGILIFLAFLWFIYAAVRVFFFIPAVVVAENHIGIRRAWHLGRGNFWRIVGIFLIVTVPLSMAVNTVTSSMLQIALGPEFGAGMVANNPAEAQKLLMDLLHAAVKLWPYYLVLQLLNFVLQAGLTTGASASAYKSLTGADDAVPAKAPA